MKKSKLMLVIISVMLVAVMVLTPSQVKAETNDNLAIVNTSNEENSNYLIYIDGLLTQEFEFALSNNNAENEADLVFEKSAKDNSNNFVAYYDKANQKFKNVDLTKPVYLWVKGNANIKAQEVNLNDSITSEKLDDVEKITTKIPVKTDEQLEDSQNVNGVKITTIVGSVKIEDDKNAIYYYQMIKLPAEEKYNQLWDMVTKMNTEYNTMTVNQKIQLSSEFSKLYTELIDNAKWTKVKDLTIEQPENTEEGTQYILFLKKVSKVDGKEQITYDAQFLTSKKLPYENYENTINEEKIITKRTSKLPITYDSIMLWVILAVIVLALIIVGKKMKKEDKKEGRH